MKIGGDDEDLVDRCSYQWLRLKLSSCKDFVYQTGHSLGRFQNPQLLVCQQLKMTMKKTKMKWNCYLRIFRTHQTPSRHRMEQMILAPGFFLYIILANFFIGIFKNNFGQYFYKLYDSYFLVGIDYRFQNSRIDINLNQNKFG